MMRFPSISLGVLAAVIFTGSMHADTLVLANGDRLTGEIVREHDEVIVFRSSVLGEISVPANRATILRETIASMDAPTTTTPVFETTAPAEPRKKEGWKRQFELGVSAQDGLYEQNNFSVRLEAARATPRGTATLLFSHHYGKSDGLLVTDTTTANALLTRNLTEDLFVRGATRYERDPVAGLDHTAEQSLGLGYTLVDRASFELSVGAGAALQHRATAFEAAGWNGLVDAFGRLKYDLNDRLSLSQDISVSAAPTDSDDYKVRSHTALVNQLTEVLQMTVRYEIEYLGATNAPVTARQRLITAIGCVF